MTTRPASLRSLLRRAHLQFAVGAIALVGAALVIPGLVTLRAYAAHDLELIGRTVGYTAEAAVVFADREAAAAQLRLLVRTEDLAAVVIRTPDGATFARWDGAPDGWRRRLGQAAARLLFDGPVQVPITHDGATIGLVEVQGGADTLLNLLLYGLGGVLLCQVAAVAGALWLSARLRRRIVGPLQALATVTAAVQRDRAFGQRVPPGDVRELRDLGDTFNLLLAELERWEAGLADENQRLFHQAMHDGLTGAWNRPYFEARLDRAMAEARRSGTALAVLLLDCNGFKPVNDTYGHAAGDAVLVSLAGRLREQVRSDDVVARIGGDEFAILLAPASSPAAVDALVAVLGQAVRRPIPIAGPTGGPNGGPGGGERTVSVGASIGTAWFPGTATDAATLLHEADAAMYRNKPTRSRAARGA